MVLLMETSVKLEIFSSLKAMGQSALVFVTAGASCTIAVAKIAAAWPLSFTFVCAVASLAIELLARTL